MANNKCFIDWLGRQPRRTVTARTEDFSIVYRSELQPARWLLYPPPKSILLHFCTLPLPLRGSAAVPSKGDFIMTTTPAMERLLHKRTLQDEKNHESWCCAAPSFPHITTKHRPASSRRFLLSLPLRQDLTTLKPSLTITPSQPPPFPSLVSPPSFCQPTGSSARFNFALSYPPYAHLVPLNCACP